MPRIVRAESRSLRSIIAREPKDDIRDFMVSQHRHDYIATLRFFFLYDINDY